MLLADINRPGPVQTIVRSARRRRTCLLALEHSGLALAIALAGVILVLLLGTQILRWYWLLSLGIAGIVIAAYRVYARRWPLYRVAQHLDAHLNLSDFLSTAWFLLSEEHPRQDPTARFQIARAERIASNIKLAGVFRFGGHRSWSLAAGLAAVAFGLFAVRYLVTDNLNLKQSMITLPVGEVLEQIERAVTPGHEEKTASDTTRQPDAPGPHDTRQNNPRSGSLGPQSQAPGRTGSLGDPSGNKTAESTPGDHGERFRAGQGQERGAGSSAAGARRPDGKPEQSPAGASEETSPRPLADKSEAGSSEQSSSGLMDKMTNALSSLMAKLHPNTNGQSQSEGNRSSGNEKSGKRADGSRDPNDNQQSARNQRASQDRNTQAIADGQTSEKAQASQSQISNESAGKKNGGEHSGIGHTNGDKAIREAEQLKAMGKLAEIIGKRSANLTGDITVETSSSNQQLKTQYSGRIGRHADLGGEINHDEIPVMYRDYVRKYMQLVHQQAEKEQ